jgi:hypothetical protein
MSLSMGFSSLSFVDNRKNRSRWPLDNPLKKKLIATLCTRGLKRSLSGWVEEGGQDKGRTIDRAEQVDWVAKGGFESRLGRHCPPSITSLRSDGGGKVMGSGEPEGNEIEKGSLLKSAIF